MRIRYAMDTHDNFVDDHTHDNVEDEYEARDIARVASRGRMRYVMQDGDKYILFVQGEQTTFDTPEAALMAMRIMS